MAQRVYRSRTTPGTSPGDPQFRRWIRPLTWLLAAVLVAAVGSFAVSSLRWPLVGDAPLFHYIVSLTQHGWAPYRQIIDLNLPGTYVVQALVMRWLGEGALAWRVHDFGLLLLIGLAMAAVCGPGRRFAALFAAAVFALIHGRDGLIDTGQRDLLMTALLLLGCAALLQAQLRRRSSFSLGLAIGAAATVKPLALLLLLVWGAILVARLRADRRPWRSHLLLAFFGAALPVLAVAAALTRWHAWYGFLGISRYLVPLHAGIFRWPLLHLLAGSVSSVLLGLFLLWLPVFAAARQWRSYQGAALLAGFAFGIVSYVAQGRGYPYHCYPSQAFWLLLAGLAWQRGLRDKRLSIMGVSVAGLLFGTLVVVPRSLSQIRHFSRQPDEFSVSLARDLHDLGGPALDGKVQCLYQAGGCLAVLYGARLIQSTGYLYDCYLFVPPADTAQLRDRDWYRNGFAEAWLRNPPVYVIVTSDECGLRPPGFSYGKLEQWPWLHHVLASRYRPVREQVPVTRIAWGGVPVLPYGYRIYRRLGDAP